MGNQVWELGRDKWGSFVVVQPLGHVQFISTPWTAALQAPLSSTVSQSLLKFLSIGSVMLPNHLILCHLLPLLLSVFPSIRVFSNVSALCIRERCMKAKSRSLPGGSHKKSFRQGLTYSNVQFRSSLPVVQRGEGREENWEQRTRLGTVSFNTGESTDEVSDLGYSVFSLTMGNGRM